MVNIMEDNTIEVIRAKRDELSETLNEHPCVCEECAANVWAGGTFYCEQVDYLVREIVRLNNKIGNIMIGNIQLWKT